MGISSVNSGTYTALNTVSAGSARNTNALGKDQFLNLLITQLKYQDPLNPTDNTEYVSQLAQFSSLEQMSNMNSGVASMQALSMTGKMIKASVTDATTGEQTDIQGVVDSVRLKKGEAVLLVGGKEVKLEEVSDVYDYSRSDISNLSAMIGQKCSGYIYNTENLDVLEVAGTVTGVEKGAYEDYALMDGVERELDSILSEDYKSSQSKLDYLNAHIGKEIDVKVTNSATAKKVPVTAELAAVEQKDGKLLVTLNKVRVPVDGIFSVNKNA